ncbi:FecCD family ABC transporter permease [Enterovibrio nigricans]|uniref:Iron complex transport system permease protein n=1 Tax=Enterovibrio nigricans DSM 22720 TaxID=1121868 RepID=A0A1T4V544_9GAMM|nr:iron ABC transporter permease [Enterovibrio nigricans]PKF50398.1 iron ABC transporter permease [Enterovibrio nigricans]SKA60108.1 iron complex transport system permease protein [Enterovibrio nigricans DSM 22720]
MNDILTRRVPARWLMVVATILLYIAVVSSITLGPMNIGFVDSLKALLPLDSELPSYISVIIQQVRLPRTLLAIAVGGILAMCGTAMQGLFRNPLADPGIIGVSAGASLGAAVAIVLFGGIIGNTAFLVLGTVPVFAFIGGALATFAIYYMGTSSNGTSVTIMLLAGVALGAIAGAGMGLLNFFADDQALRDLSLWTMGSLAGASWDSIALAYASLFILAFLFQRNAKPLNALLLGEAEARHLGIDVQKLKRNLILLTAAGVGITVALSGVIGFIGLVVPHIGRMLTGPDHRTLIPVSLLLGSLVLLVSDMVARIVVAPLEIPVGIITAAIGAPFFLALLLKQRGRLA